MAIQITNGNLNAFDKGFAPQMGSFYRISRNDTIKSVTFWLTHVPASSHSPWSPLVTTDTGRKVRAVIWVVDGKNKWSILNAPEYKAIYATYNGITSTDGWIDTNELQTATNNSSYVECKFTFNTGEIDGTILCIGLESASLSITKSALAYRKTSSNLYYARNYLFNPNDSSQAITASGTGLYMNVNKWNPLKDEDSSKPMLKLKEVKYRTLSFSTDGAQGNSYDVPRPNIDNNKIKDTSPNNHSIPRVQWDSEITGGAHIQFGGFDFSEGNLKDVVLLQDTNGIPYSNITSFNSSNRLFWVHSRSRILLTFDAWNDEGASSGYSKIRYEVSGGRVNAGSSPAYIETKGKNTTLLICPKDEGIEDNEMMEVTIYRQRYSLRDKPVGSEVSMTLVFHTFVAPDVKIASPKPHRNKNTNGTFETTEHNYVLWANDYALDTSGEEASTGEQICDILNLLLTKDGGDNSGYPIFTRFSIMEFDCNINSSTGASNATTVDSIKNRMNQLDAKIKTQVDPTKLPECTASYTGLQLDDGALIQLSGMLPDGQNWDFMKDGEANPSEGSIIHQVVTGHTPTHWHRLYSRDWRVCFRAGFKYYIRVRRFHSAVAGAIGSYGLTHTVANNIPYISGGDYIYGANDIYSGAHIESADGTTYTNTCRYPSNDNVEWLTKNNRMRKGRWVGPADGSGGKSDMTELNEIYPGFSNVDSVIIDCLPVNTSARNIIVPRPANQEIGADKWVTFAYKHLNKNFSGPDEYSSSTPGILSNKRNPDGSYMKTDVNHQMITGSNGDWGGTPCTLYRMWQMYKLLVDNAVANVNLGELKDRLSLGCHGKVNRGRMVVMVDRQMLGSYQSTYEWHYGSWSGDRLAHFSSSIILADFTFSGTENKVTVPSSGYRNLLAISPTEDLTKYSRSSGGQMSAASVFFDMFATSGNPCYGNTYNWVPVVNPSTIEGDTAKDLQVNASIQGAAIPDTNKIAAAIGVTSSTIPFLYDGHIKIDTQHAVCEEGPGYIHYSKNDTHISEYAGQLTQRDSGGGGLLYTTPGDTESLNNENFAHSTQSGVSGAQYPSNQYGNRGGGFQYCNKDNKQSTPGNLYNRIPVAYDCENGIPTRNRKVSPLSDVVQPLVRTSHMLYLKTYMFGNIKIAVFWDYDQTTDTSDETGHSHTTENIITLPDASSISEPIDDKWVDDHLSYFTEAKYKNNVSIGTDVRAGNGIIFKHILEVFGEDNNGEGRCLSAGDDTAIRFGANGYPDLGPSGKRPDNTTLPGAIDYPIRVRYTPLVQPIITRDKRIAGNDIPVAEDTPHSRNIFTLERYYTQCNTSSKSKSKLWTGSSSTDKSEFYATFSYGMYNSAYGGRYVTTRKKDDNASGGVYINNKYQYLVNRKFTESEQCQSVQDAVNADDIKYTPSNIYSLKSNEAKEATLLLHTDVYPSVGICNCFTVLLAPTDTVDSNGNPVDWTKQTPNWFSKPSNYQSLRSKSQPTAGVVLVADRQFTQSYKAPGNVATPTITSDLDATQIDHQLRTLYRCKFDFKQLVDDVSTNAANRVQSGINYDLIVIPVYTNDPSISGAHMINFKTSNAGKLYKNVNKMEPQVCGQAQDDGTTSNNVSYYGSTPLVVRKFLTITNILDKRGFSRNDKGQIYSCGGDGGDTPVPPSQDEDLPSYFEPAIIYPNVNNARFNCENGKVKECPGFWLNNTFRVIMRGPHFRTRAQMNNNPSNTTEVSLEEMTGKSASTIQPSEYIFSDIQVHFGKYKGPLLKQLGDTWEECDDYTRFSDVEFQKDLNLHSNDKEWINQYNIYSMRHNPEAFSKCTPTQKANGDLRDIIKGGALEPSDVKYADRFVEFNPNIVNAGTAYPEGYYIQFRFLSQEYETNGITGRWSNWYGGLLNDNQIDDKLNYCVPVRNFNDIRTIYRQYIKESYPGSGIKIKTAVNNEDRFDTFPGAGSESLNDIQDKEHTYNIGSGNADDTPVVPSLEIPTVGNWTNTDFPYDPQLWDDRTSSNPYNADKPHYPLNSAHYESHRVYWEMNYVDYIIRNMVKLYYSEFDGALNGSLGVSYANVKKIITPEMFGWTPALQSAYNIPGWNIDTVNPDNRGEKTSSPGGEYGKPANRNRYFRRPIRRDDFEVLNNVMRALTKFIRLEQFTGTHISKNNESMPANDPEGAFGTSVLTAPPDSLELPKNVKKGSNFKERGRIGTSLDNIPSVAFENTRPATAMTHTSANYIQRIWENIISIMHNGL